MKRKIFYFRKDKNNFTEFRKSHERSFDNEILLKNGFNWKKNENGSTAGDVETFNGSNYLNIYDLSLRYLNNDEDIIIRLKKHESYTKKFTIFLYYALNLYEDIEATKNFILLKNKKRDVTLNLETNIDDRCLNYCYYQCRLFNNFF